MGMCFRRQLVSTVLHEEKEVKVGKGGGREQDRAIARFQAGIAERCGGPD